jgi:hypothetical protein
MAHEIFISYSHRDKPTADAICAGLESQGIRCWVAPRDVLPGADYAESIIDAIEGSEAMVLVFSSHANTSPHLRKEVERAVNKAIPIIPVRIEEVLPNKAMEYYISTQHWLDALTPPLEAHIGRLAEALKALLSRPQTATEHPEPVIATPPPVPVRVVAEEPPPPRVSPSTAPARRRPETRRRALVALAGLGTVTVLLLTLWLARGTEETAGSGEPIVVPPPAARPQPEAEVRLPADLEPPPDDSEAVEEPEIVEKLPAIPPKEQKPAPQPQPAEPSGPVAETSEASPSPLPAPVQKPRPTPADVLGEAEKQATAWYEAVRKGDVETLVRLADPPYYLNDRVLASSDEIRAFYDKGSRSALNATDYTLKQLRTLRVEELEGEELEVDLTRFKLAADAPAAVLSMSAEGHDPVDFLLLFRTKGGSVRNAGMVAAAQPQPAPQPSPEPASDGRQLKVALEALEQDMTSRGFTLLTSHPGSLAAGDSDRVSMKLPALRDFVMSAVCSGGCTDLDLRLFNRKMKEVETDLGPSATPRLDHRSGRTAVFHVDVLMNECPTIRCAYELAFFVEDQ